MRGHRSSTTSTLRGLSAGSSLLIAMLACAPAFGAAPSVPRDVVGISIGSDLLVDSSFGDAGYTVVNYNDAEGTWDEAVRVIAGDGGGSWLVGFHRTNGADADRLAISKIDANGLIDPSYGTGGKLLVPTSVNLIHDAILVDGKFYISGIHFVGNFGIFGVACVGVDGTPCAGFGDGGTVTIAVNADGFNSEADRILYQDGKLYAIGNTDPGGGSGGHSSAIAIAKLDATTGVLDATFGDGSGPLPGTQVLDPNVHPDGNDYAYAAAFATNGHILVGGQAQGTGDLGSEGYILSFDPASGALDTAFGTGGYTFFSFDTGVHFDDVAVKAIQVQPDGRIVAAGNANHDDEFFNTLTNVLLVSLQPDGTPSAGFGVIHVRCRTVLLILLLVVVDIPRFDATVRRRGGVVGLVRQLRQEQPREQRRRRVVARRRDDRRRAHDLRRRLR